MIPADKTGARPAQPLDGPRCPDCGALDPCEHDESVDPLFTVIAVLACIGAVALLVGVVAAVVAIVRWL